MSDLTGGWNVVETGHVAGFHNRVVTMQRMLGVPLKSGADPELHN